MGVPLLGFALALLVMIMRRPEIITHAQFWAEDGRNWYAEAYNGGPISSLLYPHTGYFQTYPRLAMALALAVPMQWAPLVSNLLSLCVRAALVAFLLTTRLQWASIAARAAVAAYIVLMPGIGEVHANATNTQWYLGLYLLAVAVAEPPRRPAWRVHDALIFILGGLSGPFVIFVAPVLVWRQVVTWRATRNLIAATGDPLVWLALALALLQGVTILATKGRGDSPLGDSLPLLAHILSLRIFIGFAVPERWIGPLAGNLGLMVAGLLWGISVLAVVLWRGGWRMRSIVLFGALMLAAALSSPVGSGDAAAWPFMLLSDARYFVVPNVIFATAVVCAATQLTAHMRLPACAVGGALVLLGCLFDFRLAPLPDLDFPAAAAGFSAAASGTRVDLPILPPGWHMTLVRH